MKNGKKNGHKPVDASEVSRLASYGLTQEQIADFFGLSESKLRRQFMDDPVLYDAYKKGRAEALSKVAQTVYEKAIGGNVACAFFYLKTQAGWRETERVEMTGKDGGPIQYEDIEHAREQLLGRIGSVATRLGAGTGTQASRRN